jgi:hypothetical protein
MMVVCPREVVLPEVWHRSRKEDEEWARKTYKPEDVVAKLRQVDV